MANSNPLDKTELPNTTQSEGLSTRLTKMNKDGRKLNEDSIVSESTLCEAITEILEYTKEQFKSLGGTIIHKKKMSLYECQEYFNRKGGPIPDKKNKNVFMKPDGGIIFAKINDIEYPILIVEDKVQGTNDILFALKKKRQATGNALERFAKNVRGAEMIFSEMNIFPYVLFASGCDMHATETISKRLEMGNYGITNHYLEISPDRSEPQIQQHIDEQIIPKINIGLHRGRYSVASVFVKAHKWDEMPHGSSSWKKNDIVKICNKVIDLVLNELTQVLKIQDT